MTSNSNDTNNNNNNSRKTTKNHQHTNMRSSIYTRLYSSTQMLLLSISVGRCWRCSVFFFQRAALYLSLSPIYHFNSMNHPRTAYGRGCVVRRVYFYPNEQCRWLHSIHFPYILQQVCSKLASSLPYICVRARALMLCEYVHLTNIAEHSVHNGPMTSVETDFAAVWTLEQENQQSFNGSLNFVALICDGKKGTLETHRSNNDAAAYRFACHYCVPSIGEWSGDGVHLNRTVISIAWL